MPAGLIFSLFQLAARVADLIELTSASTMFLLSRGWADGAFARARPPRKGAGLDRV